MSRITSKRLRSQIQQRAEDRCEYCRLPTSAGFFSFEVDHILPPRHLETDEIVNLAWACYDCNNFKGTDIATTDADTMQRIWLFNPRSEARDDHFVALPSGKLTGKTAIGRGTIRLLQINLPNRMLARWFLIRQRLW